MSVFLLVNLAPNVVVAQSTDANPQTKNASSSNSDTTPACDIRLDNNRPGEFCVPVNQIVIKPGDSNATIKENQRQAELKRRAALLITRLVSSSSTDAVKLYPSSGQCVPFARDYSGKLISGAARNVPVDSHQAAVGEVVITYESAAGHAAVVTDVFDDYFEVIERNYFSGWVSKRKIPKFASFIKGFVRGS